MSTRELRFVIFFGIRLDFKRVCWKNEATSLRLAVTQKIACFFSKLTVKNAIIMSTRELRFVIFFGIRLDFKRVCWKNEATSLRLAVTQKIACFFSKLTVKNAIWAWI